jgi:hypothetical protein
MVSQVQGLMCLVPVRMLLSFFVHDLRWLGFAVIMSAPKVGSLHASVHFFRRQIC